MRSRTAATLPLLGLSAAAAAGFALLARAVARRHTSYQDGRIRRRLPRQRQPATKRAVAALGPLGKEWVHGPLALGAAAYAWRRGARARAATPALASAASAMLSRVFERQLRHRPPPPGRHSPSEPSFPSGHALETTAVALTSAYVLTREGLVATQLALPIGLAVPLASGVGRLYLDRHWGSDVLGGWLAGVSVAGVCAALYEALPD